MAMTAPKKVRIGDLLVEHRIISESQLSAALAEQKKSGRKLGRVLIDHGYVQEDALLKLLSEQLDMPYIDLGTFELNPSVVQRLPETFARRYRALVLKETPTGLLVGMGDPTDIFAFDELARVLKRPLTLAVVKESDLLHAIDQMYEHGAQIRNLASEIGQDLSENAFDLGNLTAESSQSDAPVVKLLQTIFEDAVRAKASDIHIEPDEDVLRIRRRVDGVLHEQVMDEKRIAAALVSRLKLMAGGDISERRKPQDGRFTLKVKDTQIDVRMATVPTQNGEAAVLRLLDQDAGRFNLDDLGMPAAVLTSFRRQIHKPHGLVLVTGPTGSGKTTTLYAALGELNRPQKKIITVEDPVEIQMSRVNQVQVNPKIGLGFAEVLRTTLRLDPDIILVGEIRDQETGEIALRASLTGHLVMSTLHTNDAVSSAIRLIDMGLEPYLVASSVSAIVAQRLVRTLCESCRNEHTPTAAEHAWLQALEGRDTTPAVFYEGAGCNKCNHTGYRGRTGVYEILELTPDLIDALRQNDQSAFERISSAESRYRPLVHHALDLAGAGQTSLEEAMRLTGWIE
ncbi:type II secretory pathway, ATPase PulE/TfP pilus assembly pathway, ATPase PilB [Thiohalobacter thiocyanaticus]|uniref:Type II secretory pathway, ATPase PulE/TfP pilus assembly pathway, ATPase PilB n=1 Tax=Thiohalobacter thiocyanaticus TaxID=585455 RepID=A0A1Z4VM64_9GAMM|nr:GspE/PulE family protein [Thiohalobacter thiocyanaticus]BAZ92575.1 type II secretory pathway, ATPase PulE/TfP pilus assembly pathway, ATPase PilB [Thiohalobacter thiocyanaticus]